MPRFVALALALSWTSTGRASPFLIIGNDEKIVWDDEGKSVLSPPGKDSVVIVDVAKPEEPKIVVSLPLENTITGPPVNMAFSTRIRTLTYRGSSRYSRNPE